MIIHILIHFMIICIFIQTYCTCRLHVHNMHRVLTVRTRGAHDALKNNSLFICIECLLRLVVLRICFCHGTLKLDLSTLFATFSFEHLFNLYSTRGDCTACTSRSYSVVCDCTARVHRVAGDCTARAHSVAGDCTARTSHTV